MGCIQKNEIIKSEISQILSKEDIFRQSLKEENIFQMNSLKNSKNNYYKSNNLFYSNSNNSGSNVTSNNKLNNNHTKNNTINSLISNDYFNNKYTLIGELNNQQNIEEFKIQLKSNPSIFRCMRKIKKNLSKNQNNNEADDNSVLEEVNLLKGINHKHICQLYECITTVNSYFLIMDFCKEGNLENKLKLPIKYSEAQIKYLAYQIFSAVQYLNKNNYMHTDIKPVNILIDEIIQNENDEDLFNIKLLNFGSYGEIESNSNVNILPYYIAPEVINNEYDITSDVWSIGVIIYQMFYGEVPFRGDNINELYSNINRAQITQTLNASSNLRDLLDLIFVKDCKKRINVNKCLEHNWFNVGNKSQRSTDIYKKNIIEEINTNTNTNKINEKTDHYYKYSKPNEESLEEKKSNKVNNDKNNNMEYIGLSSQNEKKGRRTLVLGMQRNRKNNKIFPLIKNCILFIKYYIRIYFQKDKEISKLNNIYLKYKIENNINLFINYINNTKKISFDSFYYNQNDLLNKNLSTSIKTQINNKEELFKLLIENKKKYIEMNLKKSYGKLKKSSVDEIKNIFKESNNINLYEIQKYKLYFNEIELEMEKNKYKQIYLFMDFYKLLINSINKLYTQLISNNISTNADSIYTNTNNTIPGLINKSKESIKNENSKEINDKIILYKEEKNIPSETIKDNNINKENQNNIIINDINGINENMSNNNIINNNNEKVNNLYKTSIINNNIISNMNNDNDITKIKKKKLNKTNINVKTKSFKELVMSKEKRKSINEVHTNVNKLNVNVNNKVKNGKINSKVFDSENDDDDDDYYESEKRKNNKNRFDPEKFLAIIGFS